MLRLSPPFVGHMQVFGDASGQYLQLGKCGLLPVGDVPSAMLDSSVHAGLRTITTARSLGVTFAPAGLHGIDRQQRMEHVRQRLQADYPHPLFVCFWQSICRQCICSVYVRCTVLNMHVSFLLSMQHCW